jgi:hypothetical protein
VACRPADGVDQSLALVQEGAGQRPAWRLWPLRLQHRQVLLARQDGQGTTEQLFLLLRVALAQTLSGQNETAPLILDDVTAQSDQQRTAAILAPGERWKRGGPRQRV